MIENIIFKISIYSVSTKILCPNLFVIYTCSTFPSLHAVVISCIALCSPLFYFHKISERVHLTRYSNTPGSSVIKYHSDCCSSPYSHCMAFNGNNLQHIHFLFKKLLEFYIIFFYRCLEECIYHCHNRNMYGECIILI